MHFTTFLWFALATIGFTNIVVHGKVMEVLRVGDKTLREWLNSWSFTKEMTSCYECTGFWTGMICGLFFLSWNWTLIMLPMCGFAGSVLSKTYNDFMFYMESNVSFELGGDGAEETNSR
jgi:hypothetical protein